VVLCISVDNTLLTTRRSKQGAIDQVRSCLSKASLYHTHERIFIYREFLDIRNNFNGRYVRLYGKIICTLGISHDID
jgi:hypothetical protein